MSLGTRCVSSTLSLFSYDQVAGIGPNLGTSDASELSLGYDMKPCCFVLVCWQAEMTGILLLLSQLLGSHDSQQTADQFVLGSLANSLISSCLYDHSFCCFVSFLVTPSPFALFITQEQAGVAGASRAVC